MGRGIALGLAQAGSAVAVLCRNTEKNAAILAELHAFSVPRLPSESTGQTERSCRRWVVELTNFPRIGPRGPREFAMPAREPVLNQCLRVLRSRDGRLEFLKLGFHQSRP